jgi:hypothetical protein
MAIIDVLMVVDADRVMHDHGSNTGASTGDYVPLKDGKGNGIKGSGYVFMLTEMKDAKNAEASVILNIAAKKDDIIRWRMTSMSMGNPYQCFIKEIVVDKDIQNITEPTAKHEKIRIPVLDPNSPGLNQVILSNAGDSYWESTVLIAKPVRYHARFRICEGGSSGGGTASDCGWFQWDALINS